jgi:hypothetical protein
VSDEAWQAHLRSQREASVRETARALLALAAGNYLPGAAARVCDMPFFQAQVVHACDLAEILEAEFERREKQDNPATPEKVE